MVVRPCHANDGWLHLDIYDQLTVELGGEGTYLEVLINFKRMPLKLYGDILTRIATRISIKHPWWRAPIELGVDLALALRHLHCELLRYHCAVDTYTRYMLGKIRSPRVNVRLPCVPYVFHQFVSRYSSVTTRRFTCSIFLG